MADNKEIYLEKLSVRDLRQYLRERGGHVSGTKTELIHRAKGLNFVGQKTLRELQDFDAAVEEKRTVEKFTTSLGETLPKPWTLIESDWTDNVDSIPNVRETDLYNYLILNRRRTFDSNSMKAKRQLKARVFYEDKHVHSVKYSDISENCSHGYVKCKVIPSLPTGNEKQKPDYDVWISLAKVSGHIHAAGCTCSAGEGESCNHIAALLYALVDISTKKKEGSHAVTSTKCKWNMPRKRRLSPKRAEELVFKKHKFTEGATQKIEKVKKCQPKKTVEPLTADYLVTQLKKFTPNSAFLFSDSSYLETDQDETLTEVIPVLHNVDFMYNNNVDLSSEQCKKHFKHYFEGLKVTEDECEKIECKTRGQSANKNWKDARYGRITSSNFGNVCKTKDSTVSTSAVKSVFGYNQFESKSVKWGTSHEPAARRVYSKQIQKSHPKLKLYSSGLIVSSTYPHLGASPDGLVTCEHCTSKKGLLEIKCPYKWRFISPYEAAKDKTFYCEILDGYVKLKRSHNYYYQVQGQMALSGRPWCDFFVWTLRGFSVERIPYDETFWKEMLCKLNDFYMRAVLPELFSLRVERGLSLY